MPLKDYSDQRFGRIVLTTFSRIDRKLTYWHGRCDCGNAVEVAVKNLQAGKTRSCGCLRDETTSRRTRTHALSHSPTYRSWYAMHQRCKKNLNYIDRGIAVCSRWQSFQAFLDDMGLRPKGCTLDRRENDKGYSLKNCRWATPAVQNRNTRRTRLLTLGGVTLCAADWAKRLRISQKTLRARLYRGRTVEEALSQPLNYDEVRITYRRRTRTLAQWARELRVPASRLRDRAARGLPAEQVLFGSVCGKANARAAVG